MKVKSQAPLRYRERARWRAQALEWLRAGAWYKFAESTKPDARIPVRQALAAWTGNPDRAGLRDSTALGGLAEGERKSWPAFWSQAEERMAKTRGSASP